MSYDPANPLIVQSDKTILLEVNNSRYEEARDALARFAELEKSPEHIHTYRITPLSLWNAASAGHDAEFILNALDDLGKYDLPGNVRTDIVDYVSRYGRVKLVQDDGHLLLISDDPALIREIEHHRHLKPFLVGRHIGGGLVVDAARRGHVKQALVQFGYPAEDLAGYTPGTPLEISLRENALHGGPFSLRDYQRDAIEIFHAGGSSSGGSGVIVMP